MTESEKSRFELFQLGKLHFFPKEDKDFIKTKLSSFSMIWSNISVRSNLGIQYDTNRFHMGFYMIEQTRTEARAKGYQTRHGVDGLTKLGVYVNGDYSQSAWDFFWGWVTNKWDATQKNVVFGKRIFPWNRSETQAEYTSIHINVDINADQ